MIEVGDAKAHIAEGIHNYQRGYNDGLQEGERQEWEKAIEAAAGYHDSEAKGLRRLVRPGSKLVTKARRAEVVKFAEEHEAHAAAIRRLRK